MIYYVEFDFDNSFKGLVAVHRISKLTSVMITKVFYSTNEKWKPGWSFYLPKDVLRDENQYKSIDEFFKKYPEYKL